MSIEQVKAKAELEAKAIELDVVLDAIRVLEEIRGRLDYQTNLTVCFALVQAITPTKHHASILLDLARRVDGVEIIEKP